VVLQMSRPWRHPRSGFYWFRKAIPADLRPIVGRREEKFSLKTKNPGEAQKAHVRKAAEIAEKWARLRGNAPLDHVDFHALAGEYFRQTVASKYRNPGEARQYVEQLKKNFFAHTPPIRFNGNASIYRGYVYGPEARKFLLERGYRLDDAGLDKFLMAFGDAVKMAAEQLLQISEGDYSPHEKEKKFPKFEPRKVGPELDLWETWEKYSPRLKPSSRKRWRSVMRAVEARFGRDLATLNFDDLVLWRDELIKSEVHPTTVKEVYFAAVRWLLQRAVNDRKLLANVAFGIEIEKATASSVRDREFRPDEAVLILEATLRPVSPLMSPENSAARRWIPWILAYSGARVNEISQMRATDVQPVPDPDNVGKIVWMFNITPAAGTVKSGRARLVPLHAHLIEQGFLKFVQSRSGLPLFYDPRRARKKSLENPYYRKVSERLGEWVMSLGIEQGVQPSHAWRHLFKTLGRNARIPEDILDAFQGHKPRGEGANYGVWRPGVAYRWINKIPRFEVSTPIPVKTRRMAPKRQGKLGRDAAQVNTRAASYG
jgi:integrase